MELVIRYISPNRLLYDYLKYIARLHWLSMYGHLTLEVWIFNDSILTMTNIMLEKALSWEEIRELSREI